MRSRRVKTIFEYLEVVAGLQRVSQLWFREVASPEHKLVPGLMWRNHVEREGNYVQSFLVSYRAASESKSC
jgi:hypothetical protein